MLLYQQVLETPLGNMIAITTLDSLVSLRFEDGKAYQWRKSVEIITKSTSIHEQLQDELNQYFKGQRQSFDISITLLGTPFQNEVWHQLTHISYGSTCTYQDVAQQLSSKACARAVGTALSHNPIYIIVPCHRVIRNNGQLGQYGGGLSRKRQLLEMEKIKC